MMIPIDVLKAIKEAKSILVTSHIVPDGDAIGSVLGLSAALKDAGKSVYMIVDGGAPKSLSFLPGASHIITDPEEVPEGLDLAVILDVGSYERIGIAESPARSTKAQVNVDHHATNSGFTPLTWIDTASPATGMMVVQLVKALGYRIGAKAATALFCAISTDTGSFRYSNTTAECFKTAAELIESGADPYSVSMNVYDSRPLGVIRGLGTVLSQISLRMDGKLAVMEISRSLMMEHGLSEAEVEGFISYGRSIEGVEVCVALKELEDGQVKVGFRSKSVVDVSVIAASFGGGGHKRASGCTMQGGLKAVEEEVIRAVESAIAEGFSHGRPDRA